MTSQFASSIIKLSSEGWADLARRKREPDECCIERDRLKARLGRHDDSRSGRIGKCGWRAYRRYRGVCRPRILSILTVVRAFLSAKVQMLTLCLSLRV